LHLTLLLLFCLFIKRQLPLS